LSLLSRVHVIERIAVSCSVLLAAAALAACGRDGEGASEARITVVATTTHVGDFVRSVGRDRVGVHQILEPNSDPHGYEPRPSDARAVGDALVVFRSGGELDEWLDGLIENAGGDAHVVDLQNALSERRGERDDERDPHWWQDPRNAATAVRAIRDALVEADPEGSGAYERNATTYLGRLRRLDESIAACIGKVPKEQRKLVTTHDALGYYARRYGVELVGALIPARSTQAQPSAGDTARLVRQIERENVQAIFPESALDPKLERAVARETGARVGEPLWADALGPEGSDGSTYLDAMASNTQALVEGFSGGEVSCRPAA
jgi:zinc/manganese transport system substrate-binding protein